MSLPVNQHAALIEYITNALEECLLLHDVELTTPTLAAQHITSTNCTASHNPVFPHFFQECTRSYTLLDDAGHVVGEPVHDKELPARVRHTRLRKTIAKNISERTIDYDRLLTYLSSDQDTEKLLELRYRPAPPLRLRKKASLLTDSEAVHKQRQEETAAHDELIKHQQFEQTVRDHQEKLSQRERTLARKEKDYTKRFTELTERQKEADKILNAFRDHQRKKQQEREAAEDKRWNDLIFSSHGPSYSEKDTSKGYEL